MNPGALVLLLLGYGLVLPIGARITQVPLARLRVSTVGLQLGLIVAACGWLLRSSPTMAAIHIVGAGVARFYLNRRVAKAKLS